MLSLSPETVAEFYIFNAGRRLGPYPALLVDNDSNVVHKTASGGKYDDVTGHCSINSFE